MTRNDFMKCAVGICSCAAFTLMPESTQAESGSAEMDALKWKLDAAQKRFAILVGILNERLDEPTRKAIFESLGRQCARQYSELIGQYKGNLSGFLDEIQKRWVATAEYDEKAGTIRVVDRSKTCTCPLVNESLTPQSFCDCTLGWQKETYSAILGRTVDAELEESILRGGSRCVFRMQARS
ncbi:MAG TPA: hypothetical protein VMT20_25400 [Terriglobia bacterium]|nr:hypothetical protein [Terriglobia bacterium]